MHACRAVLYSTHPPLALAAHPFKHVSTHHLSTSAPLLPPKRASLGQAGLPARGLAQHGAASPADDDGLGVREDGRDGEAAGAFDVHEEGARGGDELLCQGGNG